MVEQLFGFSVVLFFAGKWLKLNLNHYRGLYVMRERNGQFKEQMRQLFTFFTIGLLSLISCGCGPCAFWGPTGGGDDGIVSSFLVHLSYSDSQTFSEAGLVNMYEVSNDLKHAALSGEPTNNDLISLNSTGFNFFVNSYLFQVSGSGSITGENHGDSLSSCTFFLQSHSSLCTLVANPFIDIDREHELNKSGLLILDVRNDTKEYFLQDSVRFVNENEYQIRSFINPVMSEGGHRVAMIQRNETHELVRNESGQVVNDLVSSSKNDLVFWDRNEPDAVQLLVEDILYDEEDLNLLAISPDGARIAYENDAGEIVLWEEGGVSTKVLMSGQNPKFSSSGNYLIATEGVGFDKVLNVFDFERGVLLDTSMLTGLKSYTADLESDTIYTLRRDVLAVYSLLTQENKTLITGQQLAMKMEMKTRADPDMEVGVSIHSMDFVLAQNDNRVVVLLEAFRGYYYKDGC